MPDDDVLLRERIGPVELLTLNRPSVYNALNSRLLDAVDAAIGEAVASGARAILITGSGSKAFSAGADLDEFAGIDATTALARLRAGQAVMNAIETSPVPVVAAVNGLALGGGFELVLACAFPLASTTASFGLPETGLGLIPGFGGTQRLPRAIGRPAAAHLMLTGARLGAARAHELGLLPLPPVDPDALLPAALELAGLIAEKGPSAQSAVLAALRSSAPAAAHLAVEAGLGAVATAGAEAAEGIAAFTQKRPARFTEVPRS